MAFLSGLASIGSSLAGAAGGIVGALQSQSAARGMQQRQERYTERQMQNAHQWEVEDLKRAGLNPILSAHSASAVGGAGGSIGEGLGSAITSGIQAGSQAQLADSQSSLNTAAASKAIQETKNLPQQLKNETTNAQASATMAAAKSAEVEANINRIKALLPGELKNQALEIGLKAQQGKLNASEMATLESFGLTKSQILQLGKMATDVIGDTIGGATKFGTAKEFLENQKRSIENQRISIENQGRNQRITRTNKRGEISGQTYKEYY